MTNITESAMFDAEEKANSNTQRNLWMILCGGGIVMLLGAIAGFLSQHNAEGGGPVSSTGIAVLAVFIAIIFVLAFAIWKLFQQVKHSGERETRREKLNRNIILACGGLGGVMGLVIAATSVTTISDNAADPFSAFFVGPIPLTTVVPLILIWGVVMPVVAWFWHTRVIDEQEANAYRDGGYYAAYAFLILTPLWWLLWRGDLVPEPNGVAIYLLFSLVWSVVWFWKKYR